MRSLSLLLITFSLQKTEKENVLLMQPHGQTSLLTGQVAMVTGGGRGIGRAIALALAGAGASIAVIARSEEQILETQDLYTLRLRREPPQQQ